MFRDMLERKLVLPAIQIRVFLCDDTHGLEPVGVRRLDMDWEYIVDLDYADMTCCCEVETVLQSIAKYYNMRIDTLSIR